MAATSSHPQPLSRRKRFLFATVISLVVVVFFLLISEIVLRRKVGAWKIQSPAALVKVDPPKPYYREDPALGYLPVPGSFKITIPGPYSFRITHGENGLRLTRPPDSPLGNSNADIWLFGCSYTEGWTLNDEDTFPWLLQAQLTNRNVVNFGVSGYSDLQSLIQFREELKNGKKPAVIVLNYASFHDRRNTLARSWMKQRVISRPNAYLSNLKLPYMKWSANQKPELLYQPIEYREVPLSRYLALANTLDETYNRIADRTYHSHEVSKAIVDEFADLCNANQIRFILAGITADAETADMLQYGRSRGLTTIDISVDLNIRENTNLPYDDHPSALANKQYAQKLRPAICAALIDEPSCSPR